MVDLKKKSKRLDKSNTQLSHTSSDKDDKIDKLISKDASFGQSKKITDKLEKIKFIEDNDEILKELVKKHKVSAKDKIKAFVIKYKIEACSALVLFFIAIGGATVGDDIWRWIKLQEPQYMNEETTLATDPIGVFRSSFIERTKEMIGIDRSKIIPISFVSITRYEDDPVLFETEFNVSPDAMVLKGCSLTLTGALDAPTGGVKEDNFLMMLSCDSNPKKPLIDFNLIAFSPDKNKLLASPKYYLLKSHFND